MTDRERWVRTMHYEPVDHIPDEEFGYWSDTFRTWHEQGLPEFVNDNTIADRYFGFSRRESVPVRLGLMPAFETKILEEDERHKVLVDGSGVVQEVFKDGSSSIPHYIDFPLKGRREWEELFRPRLDPGTPGRYPENWEELKEHWKERDYPLGISVGSLFGWIRNWMGFERICTMMYDDPELMHDIIDHLADFILGTVERAVKEVDLDFAAFWEDMAFRSGPMISPSMFEEFLVPRYRRITSFLNEHGIDIVYVDCDGNINAIAGLWLEAGVNTMFPIEVRAGTDPIELRERFGKDMRLMGGVDKTKLIEGKEAIRKEVSRLEKLVADGGYIPHVDHRVPPDVTYENYLYYLKVKREAFGIPEPEPYEARKHLYESPEPIFLPVEETPPPLT